jgi:hypothetical protein
MQPNIRRSNPPLPLAVPQSRFVQGSGRLGAPPTPANNRCFKPANSPSRPASSKRMAQDTLDSSPIHSKGSGLDISTRA